VLRAGLGWLVSRRIFKSEWERLWPSSHWDHWLRAPSQRKGSAPPLSIDTRGAVLTDAPRRRECIFPEVSRNYNIGVHGDGRVAASTGSR
jgi:hypothetical protein